MMIATLQEMVRRKAMRTFAFFLRFCMIEDKAGASAVPFNLWPEQERVLPAVMEAPRLIILKARQLGLTWLTAAYCLWLALSKPMQLIVIISISEDVSVEYLGRIKFMLDRLPEWMTRGRVKSQNAQSITFQHPHGTSTIKSMPTTDFGAQSKTPDLLIMDESCWNRSAGEIYAASKPGIDAAGGRIIVISNSIKTAPGWSWTRGIYQGSMRGDNDFTRIFLSWRARPDRPDDFRERQQREGMDEEDVIEQYPETEEEAISTLGGSYFGKVIIRHKEFKAGMRGFLRLVKAGGKEVEFSLDAKGPVRIWRYPYELVDGWDGLYWAKRYAVGSDISEGLGETTSSGFVMDRKRDEFVAKIKSNRIDAVEWAEMLNLLALFYADYIDRTAAGKFRVEKTTSLICVELTGSGQTTVKELIKRRANQYVRIVPDKVGSGLTKQYGWPENQPAKYELAGDLKEWFKRTKGTIYDGELIDQASTFIRHENGKLGHEEGKFDDDVIGAGLTIQASNQIGDAPAIIMPPGAGWRERQKAEAKGGSAWAA